MRFSCAVKGVCGFTLLAVLCACATQVSEPPVAKSSSSSSSAEGSAPKRVRLVAVGDIMLGGKGASIYEQRGYDYPFAATKSILDRGDLVIGNLETALTTATHAAENKRYVFKNPPTQVAGALKSAGFDIVTLANNHSMDFGAVGLTDTMEALSQAGIQYHGAGADELVARSPRIVEMDSGQRVGFLAYSNTFPKEFWAGERRAGTAFGRETDIVADVSNLVALGVDSIVVSFHWGRELQEQLRDYQPLLARAAIDAGADLILGHHPHILQGVEQYKSGLILYSLGNYTFGSFSNRVQSSVIAEVSFVEGRVDSLILHPINTNNFQVQLQPQILTGDSAEAVYKSLGELSKPLGTRLLFEADKITYKLNPAAQ